ncbi:lysylphosphatidylglycerol synthase transmembrane domain-containing protein [Krasilnikovia sp. M28-CT-15]|uniref:lysylphosphatidylglycerol synthase transmembrane domain-containing protein n=1 Tax=Krasilnikovia sp. M28-CT-15 TaxID=3373540 RepID=UPI0038761388
MTVAAGNWIPDQGGQPVELSEPSPAAPPASRRRRRVTWGLRLAVLAAAAIVGWLTLRGRFPAPGDVAAMLADADLRWIAVAILLQFASQVAFALQQRRLLAGVAVRMSVRQAVAITYSRSAISMVLPAGSAMSAAFAIRQYRRHGAATATATAVTVLSGLASAAGLALLATAAFASQVAAWLIRTATQHPGRLIAAVAAVAAVGLVAGMAHRHTRWRRTVGRTVARWPVVARVVGQARQAARDVRSVGLRDWAATIAYAAVNWLLDLACLVAAARAMHVSVPWRHLATAYLAVQIARQIPLTPGGIGLIEASLLTALVAGGIPEAGAAAVVLAYRLISFWLILPPGLTAYVRLRPRPATARLPRHSPSPRRS